MGVFIFDLFGHRDGAMRERDGTGRFSSSRAEPVLGKA